MVDCTIAIYIYTDFAAQGRRGTYHQLSIVSPAGDKTESHCK